MEIKKFFARVREVSAHVVVNETYVDVDGQTHETIGADGQTTIRAQYRDVTFDDGRLKAEVFGPFRVFGPASRFDHPVGTPGMLTLQIVRRQSREGQGYYMNVELVDFEAGVTE